MRWPGGLFLSSLRSVGEETMDTPLWAIVYVGLFVILTVVAILAAPKEERWKIALFVLCLIARWRNKK
jgi:hypothetical protein